MKAPLPPNEAQRLETLRQYAVLDTPPEQAFDDLTLLASQICQAPIAMVSLIDENRQWFKSKIGINATETSRDIAFCAHTILNVHEVLEVRDACADSRFADSSLVTTDPHIRFYAGAPLVAPDGHALGALCVMDREPHALTAEQLASLRALGRNVVAQLELRREVAERQRVEALLHHQYDELLAGKKEADRLLALGEKSRRAIFSVLEDERRTSETLRVSEERFRQLADNINEVFWIATPLMEQMIYVSPAYERIWGRTCESLRQSPKDWVNAIHSEDIQRVHRAVLAKMASGEFNEIYRIKRLDGAVRWVHDRGFPVRNAAGEVYRIVGVAEDITKRKQAEAELEAAHLQLVDASRQAGMAEMATSVLHNVGNVLNSVNVASSCMATRLRKSKAGSLSKVNELLHEHEADLGAYLTSDPKGKQIPGYLAQLAGHLVGEQSAALTELADLQKNIEHIKEIVTMQQSGAKAGGFTETLDAARLMEDAFKMNETSLGRHDVKVVKEFDEALQLATQKHKALQILVNLIRNASQACDGSGQTEKRVTLRVKPAEGRVCFSVSDNGVGIPPENLPRIFSHGFTTKKDGHGFGLHNAALVAKDLGGALLVHSDGAGKGSTFTLELPCQPPAADA